MTKHATQKPRIILGITGASGAIYGIRLLEALKACGVETHLVISKSAQLTITQETEFTLKDIQKLASYTHAVQDVGANIASGSFETLGMIIAPCSMKTLAEVATGLSLSLLTRAADVVLKERRRLVLVTRETPLTTVHLRHMVTVSEMGGIIAPPVPAFYTNPKSLDDMVNHQVGRVLDLFWLESGLVKRWQGLKNAVKSS